MVKQRFLMLFRRWLFTFGKVLGPILLFEGIVSVRQYLQYVPLAMSDWLAGVLIALLATACMCWLWALGECWWSRLRRIRGIANQHRHSSRRHLVPEIAKSRKT